MNTATETKHNDFNISTVSGGFCHFEKKVKLAFKLFTLSIDKEGALEVTPNVLENADFADASIESVRQLSHLVDGKLDGAQYQDEYESLAYGNQDEFTQRFANVEHVALHLWIDEMLANDLTRESKEDFSALLTQWLINDAVGEGRGLVEEYFITNVQLLANGIQPNAEMLGVIGGASAVLGLTETSATVSALAFINYLRGYLRNTFKG